MGGLWLPEGVFEEGGDVFDEHFTVFFLFFLAEAALDVHEAIVWRCWVPCRRQEWFPDWVSLRIDLEGVFPVL